jgi:DNA (cytosine-5)-methyltransferase 1
MLRAIREIQPRWIVGENVRGLTNWNAGLVFDEVQADLETLGYEITPFLLPACAINAPHRRDRIWFVAYANSDGQHRSIGTNAIDTSQRGFNAFCNSKQGFKYGTTTNANSWRRRGLRYAPQTTGAHKSNELFRECNRVSFVESDTTNTHGTPTGHKVSAGRHMFASNVFANTYGIRLRRKAHWTRIARQPSKKSPGNYWKNFPTQPPICGRNDGLSARLDFDTVFKGINKPRKPITVSKWRNETIKAYGNAIVPQMALQIFKAIEAYENLNNNK